MSNEQMVMLRAALEIEMRRRKIPFTVGSIGEGLVISHFKSTPGLPKLQLAPSGTKNVDALSRDGDRYSIKTLYNAKKTGTIYPDSEDREKQLFEYLLIAKLDEKLSLKAIYQIPWAQFVKIRSWDKRMNAWYVAASKEKIQNAELVYEKKAITLELSLQASSENQA